MAGQQVDLFLDQLIDAPIKDDRALMEFPFFTLQKQPRHEPFRYDDGAVTIDIQPGPKGMASIYDKDVLIYLASVLNDRIERGAPVDRTIRFPAYDFLKVTGRGTGKRAYELFLDALFRLRSTTIVTTIVAGDQKERRGFGWIESWRIIERETASGQKVMAAVEITLNDWMFRAVVKDRRVLTINRDYFSLTMGLERRLYELARKHVGHQPEWVIGLARLAEKCGSSREVRKFKTDLQKIITRASIPDYRVELVVAGAEDERPFRTRDGQPMVRFTPLDPATVVIKPRTTEDQAVTILPPIAEAAAGDAVPRISIKTFEEARRLFPGYDVEHLERRWQAWTAERAGNLRNPDKAFLAWCRTYTSNNPL